MKKQKKNKVKKTGRFYRFAHKLVAGFFRWIFRVRATGQENIPEGGCILCINHTQLQDALVIGASIKRQVRFLGKKELFRIPIVGWLCRSLGAVSVDRGGGDVGAMRTVIALAKEGEITAIFPQGHRYKGVNPLSTPIHSGIGMMAYRANVPVVPVCIKLHKQRYSLFHPTEVIIGKPMSYTDVVPDGEGGMTSFKQASHAFFRAACALGGYHPDEKEDTPCK